MAQSIEKMNKNIDYMGDGVYIEFDGFGYIIRANHHEQDSCTDQIYIEPSVLKKITNFVLRMQEQRGE